MTPHAAETLTARIRAIETEIAELQSIVNAEQLATNQRQYLARCFDLLHMELTAVRTYIAGIR